MSEIPDERDITKTQLWQRIDTMLETINLVGRNTADNLSATLPALRRDNELALAEFKSVLKNAVEDMREMLDLKIKFIEKLNNDGYGKMVNEGSRLRVDIDKRFQSLRENLSQELKEDVSESFKQLSQMFREYALKVDEYKKQSVEQVSSLQKEMGFKLGEVVGKFMDMKKRFKTITEQLQ